MSSALKRFGTIYPFVESKEASLRMGRLVANFEFLKALLQNASFDEYYFFSPEIRIRKMLAEKLDSLRLPAAVSAKLKFFSYLDIKNVLSKLDFQVFHLGGFGHFMAGLAYLRNNHGKNLFPITAIIHSLNGFESPYHFLKISTAPFYDFDRLVCSSKPGMQVVRNYLKATQRHFDKCFSGQLSHIPLGIDDSHFAQGGRDQARKELGWNKNTLYLLCIGRFSPVVKVDYGPLLLCLRQIRNDHPQLGFRLVLAGGCDFGLEPLKGMIREFGLQGMVDLMVDFEDSQKPLLYDAADIFLSLSDNYQETFGLAVVEAMAHGLPCIVTDFDGYKDLVTPGQEGFRIRTIGPGQNHMLKDICEVMNFGTVQLLNSQNTVVDLVDLRRQLESLLRDPELRIKVGNRASKAAITYKWSNIIRQYEQLWLQLYEESSQYSLPQDRDLTNPFEISYSSIFGHYCTEALADNSVLCLTGEGKRITEGTPFPGKYTDLHSLLVDEFMLLVLGLLREKNMAFDQLQRLVETQNVSLAPSFLKMHVMWMAKYGLVHIQPSE